MEMNLQLNGQVATEEFNKILLQKDMRIRYLEREVLRLGGGIRCPHCTSWESITVENQRRPCYTCGGLGYYIPREE